jgi:reductive dehalogenase
MNRILTDMPLALTRPIDAGTVRCCATCGICAKACPYDALAKTGGPRWDHWAEDEEALLNYSNVGAYYGFRLSRTRCPKCRSCQAACPFNSSAKALIHTVVEATAATTTLFNGFLSNMSEFFGYGHKNPNDWWDMDLPIFDLDTSFTER